MTQHGLLSCSTVFRDRELPFSSRSHRSQVKNVVESIRLGTLSSTWLSSPCMSTRLLPFLHPKLQLTLFNALEGGLQRWGARGTAKPCCCLALEYSYSSKNTTPNPRALLIDSRTSLRATCAAMRPAATGREDTKTHIPAEIERECWVCGLCSENERLSELSIADRAREVDCGIVESTDP